jgi:putative ABC transport system permease protein
MLYNTYSIRGRSDESFILQSNWVDYDYLKTFGIKMADGRFFDPEMLSDQQAVILNERAVRNYKLEDPFATRIVNPGEEQEVLPVIGVVADYHFESLHHDISPAIMQFKHDEIHWGYVSIRYESGAVKSVLERTEEIWSSFTANEPMLYMFMDDDFNRLYREEEQNAYLSVIFTLLAILIASMGLYGLTAFSLQQRTREISIRKTFGASISGIWYMICKDVMVLIAMATLIAWPLVYWVATNWLQNYHYRISLQLSDFLIGFVLAVIISLLTISYRVIRTASVNPAITMRYE